MARNTRALILALLCVLAVSLAAATLANPQEVAGSGPGSGSADQPSDVPQDEQSSDDDGDGSAPNERGGAPLQIGGACIPFLLSWQFFLGGFAVLAGGTWLLKRRENLVYGIAVVGPLALFLLPIWLILTDCGGSSSRRDPGKLLPEMNPASDTPSGGSTGGDTVNQLLSPPVLLGLVVVLAIVVAVVVYRASGDDTVDEEPDPTLSQPEPGDAEALSAIGAAAGDAADRIEAAVDVDNEVYRAWREMTTHVDVPNPETSTPGEFATAASDAGMAERDVDDLTDLFRAVRYGGQEATDDREQAAVDALRSIEAEYANGGGA